MDFSSVLQILKDVPWLWNTVSQQWYYVRDLSSNVDTLVRETNELKRKRVEFEEVVKAAESVGKKRLRHVGNWFNDVDKVVPEIDSIESKFDSGIGNLYLRRNFGKSVVEKMAVVKKLNDQGNFKELAKVPRQSSVQKMQVPMQLEQQSTSKETLEKIEQAILNEDIGILCVCGMGGVGKTTLMKKMYNGVVETQDFHQVIWVTVSKDLNLHLIQKEIGRKLGMRFPKNDSIEEKRDMLKSRLQNVRFMLILDDLWQSFSLDQVGIPKPDKQNRCKIVITSRLVAVSNAMEVDSKIKVTGLTSREAWDLFYSITGNVVRQPEIKPIAEAVVEECGQLPLAITTVGGAMRLKHKKEQWLNALRALRRAVTEVPNMEKEVFLPLKLSYDYLDDPKIQLCFLYCSLFPEDWLIDVYDLLRCWFSEGLIDNVDSLEEAFYKGHDILERLKDACLLETKSDDTVIMHDLLRDLAIWITSPSSSPSMQATKFLLKASEGLVRQPEEKNWEGVDRISLMGSYIAELQIVPNCPKLVTLFLRHSLDLCTIHADFFQLMPELRVLDLSSTRIVSLPPSFSNLVNLRALILTSCAELQEMPPMGQLKELQMLDLSMTSIKELPEGISNLFRLKQLDISHTPALDNIPCHLISALTCLEHLRLLGAAKMEVTTLQEVTTLTRLAYLDINIPDLNGFNECDTRLPRRLSNLKRFHICIGKETEDVHGGSRSCRDILGIKTELTIHGCNLFHGWIAELISHADSLKISNCNPAFVPQIISYSDETLRCLYIDHCDGVKCIIDWRKEKDTMVFDCLGLLQLQSLPDLENIFNGGPSLPATRFQELTSVVINGCPKLRFVFSSSLVSHLPQLNFLWVEHCEGVEEIVEGDELPDNVLQNLAILFLHNLPKLTSICRQLPVFKFVEDVHVSHCPQLKKLPLLCSTIQTVQGYIAGQRNGGAD